MSSNLTGLTRAYATRLACRDMKSGRQDFHSKPSSSNLTGLTRANDYWIARMDMKFDMQYLHGDLSGFNIYWLSPAPTQPNSLAGIWSQLDKTFISNHPVQTWQVLPEPMIIESRAWTWNSTGNTSMETCQVLILLIVIRAYTTRLACRDMKPGKQDFHSEPSSSNLTGLTRAIDYWIACIDMKFGRQYLHGDLSGFVSIKCSFSISNSCSRLVYLWPLSSTICPIWKSEGLLHYELLFQHSLKIVLIFLEILL